LLLLQGQLQCVLVALAKTVSQFTHNCTHIHPAPAHRVSYLHSLVLPCEAGTNFTYKIDITINLYTYIALQACSPVCVCVCVLCVDIAVLSAGYQHNDISIPPLCNNNSVGEFACLFVWVSISLSVYVCVFVCVCVCVLPWNA